MRGLVIPERTEDFTADPVELFFDLAFVFAFSQLVSHLVHHPTWTGAAEAGLLFLILWFAWSTFTWAANAVSGNDRPVRALFLIATATSVPMGASVTTAYDTGGGTFAICAAVLILMALGLQVWALDSSSAEFQSIVRFGGPNVIAMVLLIGGGFLTGAARPIAWVIFVLVILGTMAAAGESQWIIRSGHFAERHGLIVIIALGEVIVAIGISVVNSLTEQDGLPRQTLLGLIAAGALAGLLWWGYFDRLLPALEHRAEALQGTELSRLTRDAYTLMHIPIVAGIITTAAAAEEILLHPDDVVHSEFRIMLAVGLTMFFGGIAAAAKRAWNVLAIERLAAIAVLVLLVLATKSVNGVAVLIAVDVVLLLSIVAEHVRIEQPHAT